MKKLLHYYEFTPSQNKIVVEGIYKPERFLLITNVTTNQTIFTFNSTTAGLSSITYDYPNELTTLILDYDCSAMSAADKLQIFVEQDFGNFEPSDTFVDPVSKLRVSQPSNLIDTDFEYGLQSTKWETLEKVKNIPTFFSRNGDQDLAVTDITITTGSDLVTVTLSEVHNLLPGSPVIVIGSKLITCDGGFVVTSVPSTTSFTYRSKSILNFTGSIKDTYTQVFPGSLYTGTEFDISGIEGIVTDGATASDLTVSTAYPTNFQVNTSFFLSNSKATVSLPFNTANTSLLNYNDIDISVTNNTPTGESNTGFMIGSVNSHDFTPRGAIYFTSANVSINGTTDTLTFDTPHGITDNTPYVYFAGEGNGNIGGLLNANGYYIRVLSTTQIYFTETFSGTARVNLDGTYGSIGGIMRSALVRAYRLNSVDPSGFNGDAAAFDQTHGLNPSTDNNTSVLFFDGNGGGLPVVTSLSNSNFFAGRVYYWNNISSMSDFNFWARFTYSPSSNLIQLGSGSLFNIGAYMIKVDETSDSNSIYFANHGLTTGALVQFIVTSGTVPTGLANNAFYTVEVVSSNRVKFNDVNGNPVRITSIGSTTGVYRLVSRATNLDNDSILIPRHNLTDGTLVRYDSNSNTAIGGLTNSSNYYVFRSTTDRFKLSTTQSGFIGSTTVNQPSRVDLTNDILTSSTPTNVVITHGFTTGQAVLYTSATPIGGLTSGGWYWVRVLSTTTFQLHWTAAGATNNTDRVNLVSPIQGTGTFQTANLVDLTSTGTGIQKFVALSDNAADGVYTLTENVSDTTFKITANNEIPLRSIDINPIYLDLNKSSFYVVNHGLITGTPVTYTTTGTAIGGLTNSTVYYVIRTNKDWFSLALTAVNADEGINITTTNKGTGTTHILSTSVVSGEVLGAGTISGSNTTVKVIGSSTNFPAVFTSGNILKIYQTPSYTNATATSYNTTTDVITAASHTFSTNDTVILFSGTTIPQGTGIQLGGLYYVRVIDANNFQLHPTPTDATNNTNRYDITVGGSADVVFRRVNNLGNTKGYVIKKINSTTELELLDPLTENYSSVNYAISSSLLLRSDGFALHRPYDGGVELVPSKNPDASMVRQTRKYFRYQSGKGIQVSFAINFSPTVTIDTMTRVGNIATIVTRYPNRVSSGLELSIFGATVSSGVNYWNGTFEVLDVIDEYTFRITLNGTPTDSVAQGLVEYFVTSWAGSLVKCGLFDDQNGLYFEYSGNELSCVRRSSTQQISGTATVEFKQAAIVGTNTKFLSQLSENDKIVIKGQTYVISKIVSNTLLYILPSYRGADSTNVIITKTVDTKIPQSLWNLDVCDGTGPTGFYLDIHKIQMAYMDYSWYGAGKVRFGFKDQRGKVVYVHEFIHNNKFTEAYMRSGNIPARYEIENVGEPTYVPSLAHWGTSVIMDGRFDDDKAYIFSASSNQLSIANSASIVASANVESTSSYFVLVGNQYREAGRALNIQTPSVLFNSIPSGAAVSGAEISAGTVTASPRTTQITPFQPYLAGVTSRYGTSFATTTTGVRNLLLLSNSPLGTAGIGNYTITLSSGSQSVVYEQPIISIRLAPSVDNGTPGLLGEREIINRMQLILDGVGIQTTHTCEILLKLNGQLNRYDWKRVTNPSLSQLIYHDTTDRITGGSVVFTFRASGSTGTTGRVQQSTVAELGDIVTLGNSILGGDNVYPDGPDILTVVVRLIEDPSTVTSTNPFIVGGRISWSESQA